MQVIPAIDLIGGRAVRLRQGRYDQVTTYDRDPAELAKEFRRTSERLHVVDLEGARAGRPLQTEVLARIVEAFGSGVQVGGGLRSLEAIETALASGVSRVVLGTAAAAQPEQVASWAASHPDRIVLAVDARDGRVATDGWEKTSELLASELVAQLEDAPLAGVLYTDIERDGTGVGPNVAATAALAQATRHPVIASGGVGSLAHLRALAQAPGPIAAVVIGRALHEGRISLEAARQAALATAGGET